VKLPLRFVAWCAFGLLALAGAGAIGYAIGHQNTGLVETVHTGMAGSTGTAGTATADGFTYILPPDVSWIDSVGTIHGGAGPPPCLRHGGARRVEFATVKYPIAGATEAIVVWVKC
jgi:hypothetical protein